MTAETTTNPTPQPNDTTATLTVGLGVGAAMSDEVGGKSLGDRAADVGEWVYRGIKGFFS